MILSFIHTHTHTRTHTIHFTDEENDTWVKKLCQDTELVIPH